MATMPGIDKSELDALLYDRVREATRLGRNYRVTDGVRDLELSQFYIGRSLARLAAAGGIIALPFKDGYVAAACGAAATVTFRDVLELSRRRVREGAAQHHGRQAVHVSQNVEFITPAQLAKIERFCDIFARRHFAATHPESAVATSRRNAAAPEIDGCLTSDKLLEAVPMYLLRWDAAARNGGGDWVLALRAQAYAEEIHREKYERRHANNPSAPKWQPQMAVHSVRDQVGTARLLCNLAATGATPLIDPSPRNLADATIYSESWVRPLLVWYRWLFSRRGTANGVRVHRGLQHLAIYATRLGYADAEHTNWMAVRDAIIKDLNDGRIRESQFYHVRWVYRRLVALFRERGVHVPAEADWPLRRRRQQSLAGALNPALIDDDEGVESHLAEWSAELQKIRAGKCLEGSRGPSNDSDGGVREPELVAGRYGVRALCQWLTLEPKDLLGTGLPWREWHFDRLDKKPRQGKSKRPRKQRPVSLRGRLATISAIAFYAADWIDWYECGMEAMADVDDVLRGYVAAAVQLPGRGRTTKSMFVFAERLHDLGQLACGFLAARAQQDIDQASYDAERAETEELRQAALGRRASAEALKERFRKMYEWCWTTAGHLMGESACLSRGERRALIRERNKHVERAWRRGSDKPGLHKIAQLRDLVIRDAVAAVDGMPLEEQLECIRRGAFAPRRMIDWASHVRLACVLTLEMLAPLRGSTLTRLTLDMWVHDGPPRERHRGAVYLNIPGDIMKSGRPTDPSLIASQEVGSEAHETLFCRPLWDVYLSPAGARDTLLTVLSYDRHGEFRPELALRDARGYPRYGKALRKLYAERAANAWQINSDYLFPSAAERRGRSKMHGIADVMSHRARWTTSAVSSTFNQAVARHAGSLGIDFEQLSAQSGALGIHVLRRLFGSAHALTRLVECSRRLDHTDIRFTHDVYCGVDERAQTLVLTL